MADPVFDPELPRNNSPIVALELRDQFLGLESTLREALNQAEAGSAVNPAGVTPLALTVANPPTQAQVQAIADKLDELITALQRG